MPAATWMARRFAWVDDPGPLKVHARPVPDTGGLAIALACILSIALTTEARPAVVAVVAAAAAMATLGFFDDRRRLSPWLRLVAGAVASVGLMAAMGALSRAGSNTEVLWQTLLVTLYLVGAVNAVNMQDGLDGLAGALVLVSCVGCIVGARI